MFAAVLHSFNFILIRKFIISFEQSNR